MSPGRGIPSCLAGRIDGPTVIRRVFRSGYNPIGEPACTPFRRDAKDRAGSFSGLLPGPTDLDMWFRILELGDFYGDQRTLASFRLHPRSLTPPRTGAMAVRTAPCSVAWPPIRRGGSGARRWPWPTPVPSCTRGTGPSGTGTGTGTMNGPAGRIGRGEGE